MLRLIVITQSRSAYFLRHLRFETSLHIVWQDKLARCSLRTEIANLRDVADSPPVDWPLARRQEYFDWAKQVVDRTPEPSGGPVVPIYGDLRPEAVSGMTF